MPWERCAGGGAAADAVRYDRLVVIWDAFTTFAASVICYRILLHDVT
jgi:hypothetical protein